MISLIESDVTSTSIKFDAYTATMIGAKPIELLNFLCDPLTDKITQGKGFHTFGERIAVKDGCGDECGSISWGGSQGDRVMFEVKGSRSPMAVEQLRGAFPHKVTRVDSCADFDALGAFEHLLQPCSEVKKLYRLKGSKAGDWEDFPEDGRTLYLGAASSTVKLRLYEKGKQPEYRHHMRDNWARIEVQVRPAKEAKYGYSKLSAMDVWGASKWSRDLADRVLGQHVDPHPAGTVYRLTDDETSLRWMSKQYLNVLERAEADAGSAHCFGLTLIEYMKQARAERDREKGYGHSP